MANEFDDALEQMPEGFRTAYKQLKKDAAAMAERLAGYETKEQKQNIEATLKDKGINPLIANLYNGDDKSPEAVLKWVEDNKSIFNLTPVTEPLVEGTTPDPAVVVNNGATTPADQQAAQARMAALAGNALAGGQSAEQAIRSANNPEELAAAMAAARAAGVS